MKDGHLINYRYYLGKLFIQPHDRPSPKYHKEFGNMFPITFYVLHSKCSDCFVKCEAEWIETCENVALPEANLITLLLQGVLENEMPGDTNQNEVQFRLQS